MKTLTAALFLLAPFYGLGQTPASGSGSSTAPSSTPPSNQTSTPAPQAAAVPTQATPPVDDPKVSVTSRGSDIRVVLTNIFAQAKRSLILQPTIQFNDTEFSKAVDLICTQANLKYDIRDGIYHVFQKKAIKPDLPSLPPATMAGTGTMAPIHPSVQAPGHGVAETPQTTSQKTLSSEDDFESKPTSARTTTLKTTQLQTTQAPKPEIYPIPVASKTGKLSVAILRRHVTTKLAKAPIGAVLEELGEQAGVKIEIGEDVPAYRLDAVLNNTTLRYALEEITRAAKLTYTLTDHQTILVDTRS